MDVCVNWCKAISIRDSTEWALKTILVVRKILALRVPQGSLLRPILLSIFVHSSFELQWRGHFTADDFAFFYQSLSRLDFPIDVNYDPSQIGECFFCIHLMTLL